MKPVLQCEGVTVTYSNGHSAVRDLSLLIEPGECVALVGESGCGKTTLARAALGLLPAGTLINGSIRIDGVEIVGAPGGLLRGLRGMKAGFVAQDPFGACDPLSRVESHVAEAWRAHGLPAPREQYIEQMNTLGIPDTANRLRQYPHEWSGGMLQRATIAAATAHRPPLLVADEPTSALDADHARSVLELLQSIGAALLLISHDLHLVARYAHRVAVCRDGQIVELGATNEILARPQHAYTIELLAASPRAQTEIAPPLNPDAEVIAKAEAVSKTYGQKIQAVSRVSLSVRRGEIVGIHGPSGSGKSTLLRLLSTIEAPTEGAILLGEDVAAGARSGGNHRRARGRAKDGFVMPIFQDPISSLDRRWPVWRTITEPLMAKHRRVKPARPERLTIARDYLRRVGLAEIDLEARPDELSVGQCQRVAVARALVAAPKLIVADEPTSALDAVIAASVLRLLGEAAAAGTALVIVSHDQDLLRAICHRVMVMKSGQIEEEKAR